MNGIGKWREIKSKTIKVLMEDGKGNLQRMQGRENEEGEVGEES